MPSLRTVKIRSGAMCSNAARSASLFWRSWTAAAATVAGSAVVWPGKGRTLDRAEGRVVRRNDVVSSLAFIIRGAKRWQWNHVPYDWKSANYSGTQGENGINDEGRRPNDEGIPNDRKWPVFGYLPLRKTVENGF